MPPSSHLAEVGAGSHAVLARWQARAEHGQPCTIWGSRAQQFLGGTAGNKNDGDLSRNVLCQLRIMRGAVIDVETFPWPACGFVRRVVANEVTVSAIGVNPWSAFTSDVTGYQLGAAVLDGVALNDTSARTQWYSMPEVAGSFYAAQAVVPLGTLEFRLRILNQTGVSSAGYLLFASTSDQNVPGAPDSPMEFGECHDWTLWPSRYSAVVWVPSDPSAWISMQFRN